MSNEQTTITTDTSPTFFSGWRPLVGWVAVTALALNFVIFPTVEGFTGHTFPKLDFGPIATLIVGVLGLGGLRTIEKLNCVDTNH